MANTNFEVTFKKLLKEDAIPNKPLSVPPVNNTPTDESDADAWKKSLDDGTNVSDFEATANPQHSVSKQNLEVAKQWVKKIDDFKSFINGLEPKSLAVQLNKMDRDGSVFRGIVKSESKRLIKIAEGLGGFNEILRSYIIGAEKKSRDLQAQTSKSQ